MSNHETITLTLGLALWMGVTAMSLARRLRVPPLLFYLLAGLALGPMGLGWISPQALGDRLSTLVEFGLAIILFEGALSLPSSAGGALPHSSRRLLGIGIPMTAVLSALTAHFVAGLDPLASAAFGALISVTGPTTIGPLLRSLAISRRLEVLLRNEAIWGDCLGILMASLVLPFWIQRGPKALASLPYHLFEMVGLAAVMGVVAGVLLARWVLPALAKLGEPELPGMAALAWAILAFTAAQTLSPGSGPIASAVAGFTLVTMKGPFAAEIRLFKGQVAYLFISMLFVLLSGLFHLSAIQGNLTRLLLTALILGFIVRPASLFLAFWGTELPMAERLFTALIGPRGIVALATASFVLTQRGDDPMAREAFALTFLVIALSAGFATLMGRPLAWLLRIRVAESRTGIVIVGINPFSTALATALSGRVPVRLLDSDPAKVQATAIPGVEVVQGNALDESLYEDAAELGYRRVLAATPNDALNGMVLEHAEPVFGRNRLFRIASSPSAALVRLRPHLAKTLAFSEEFHTGLLPEGGRWRIREAAGTAPGLWPLASLKGDGVRLIRGGGSEPPPYLVLEMDGPLPVSRSGPVDLPSGRG